MIRQLCRNRQHPDGDRPHDPTFTVAPDKIIVEEPDIIYFETTLRLTRSRPLSTGLSLVFIRRLESLPGDRASIRNEDMAYLETTVEPIGS
jgi:hypothetical protein